MNEHLISQFHEPPKSKLAWWAMGLGLSTMFIFPGLSIFAAFLRPLLEQTFLRSFAGAGFVVGMLALALSIAALVTGIQALRIGERSWAVWLGFVPAVLAGLFWILLIIGEFLFPH